MASTTFARPTWFFSYFMVCQYACTSMNLVKRLKKFISGKDASNMLVSLAKAKPMQSVRSSVKI